MKKIKFFYECDSHFLIKTFRIMRITIFILLASILQTFAIDTYSQKTMLSLDATNQKLVDVLDDIENRSEFYFLYNEKLIDTEREITVSSKNQKISEILDELFAGTDVLYTITDRKIILAPAFLSEADQQQTSVSGTVTDENGQSIPGVTVLIKGTTQGTVTDDNGKYSVSSLPENATLQFSFVGMRTQEIEVGIQTIINISLVVDAVGIDEVVAIGYGTKRRADISGSVSVVNTNELERIPSQSAELALQGLASGVNVIPSGVPGAGARIFIRGVTNFGNTNPLVIVDGIEQDLNNISAKDIESMQVLKDAGSASIYGVRGANGVILVTTKKGKTGAPIFSYEGSYGMQYALSGNPFNTLNSEEFMELYKVAFGANDPKFRNGMPDYMYRGPGGSGVANEGDPLVDPSLYSYESPNPGSNYIIQKVNKEGTDWFHELFKDAPVHKHNLSVSGATDKAHYFLSLGYLDQTGTLVKTYLKRYSARVNTDYTLGNHIRVGENLNIIYKDAPGYGENSDFGGIIETVKQEPIVPIKDIGGNWGGSFGGPSLGDAQNPVAVQYRDAGKDISNTWYIIGNAYAEVDFLNSFTAKTSLGYNIVNNYNQNYTATQVENVQASTNPASLGVSSGYGSTMTFTNTLDYNKKFGNHYLGVLVGSEAISYTARSVSGSRSSYFSTDFNFLVLDNGTQNISNSSSIYETSLFSIFGRLDYTYANKYLFSATVRRDGSSKFGANSRYGTFPAFSVAWRLSEESFMQDLTWLNDFKIRGSYGVLGSQDNVSAENAFFLYSSGMTSTYYDITGSNNSIVQGFAQSRIGNQNTSWEENAVTNVGFDMVIKDSWDISLEYYKKSINGLLFTQPLPAAILGGSTSPSVNIGDIQNTGLDASLTYRGQIVNDFNFSVGANFTTYNNEIVNIPDPGYFDAGSNQAVGAMARNQEGHPISAFFGYEVIGLFDSAEEVASAPPQDGAGPGRFRFADSNGDLKITPDDRVFLGDPHPDFTYSLNLTMDYMGFDLSALFYGSQGNDVYNLTKSYLDFFSFYPPTNKSKRLLNAWTPTNKDTDIPIIETTRSPSTAFSSSSYYIEDGSFLKLRSLTLGYTINPSILQKVNISQLRIYIQGANLFTITGYSGLDPELIGGSTSAMGVDRGSYPNNEKAVYVGVNLKF